MFDINKKQKKIEPKDKNDEPHGEWCWYWDNGQIMYRWNYFHGKRHGLDEGYYENGVLKYRVHYNLDKKIGYWYYMSLSKTYFLCLI